MKTKNSLWKVFIIVALISSGVNSLNAQSLPRLTFNWSNGVPQDCYCPMVGTSYWRIDVAIINECGEDFYTEWQDYRIVSSSTSSQEFFPNWSCDDSSNEQCYLVTGVVRKLCPDGHGGFTVQCTGKFNLLLSCYQLMHTSWPVNVAWDLF
jgi:hypothetical protein